MEKKHGLVISIEKAIKDVESSIKKLQWAVMYMLGFGSCILLIVVIFLIRRWLSS